MMIVRFITLFCGLFIAESILLAQSGRITFERIGTEQGLSHLTVTDIIQDRRGFFWFTTLDGLNRFDGYSCLVFRNNPEDSTTLPTNFLHGIREDREGILWITSRNGGLTRFDPSTGIARRYLHDPNDPHSIANNKTGALLIENDSLIWVGTDSGLDLLNTQTGRFTHYRHDPNNPKSLSHPEVTLLFKDRKGTLWVGTFNGLNRFDPTRQTFQRFVSRNDDPYGLDDPYVRAISEDEEGNLWVGTSRGLSVFDRTTGRFHSIKNGYRKFSFLHGLGVTSIYRDKLGRVWFGTTAAGLCLYDPTDGSFMFFRHNPVDVTSLSQDNAIVSHEDSHGTLWISTWGGGVNRYVPGKRKFAHISAVTGMSSTLKNNFVFSFLEDRQGTIWVGTGGNGVNRFTRSNRSPSSMALRPDTPRALERGVIWSLLESSDGSVWIGSTDGLTRFDPVTQSVRVVLQGSTASQAKSLLEDRDGMLWVGTESGTLRRLNRKTGVWTVYDDSRIDPLAKGNGKVWALKQSRDGRIWFGTFMSGLGVLDGSTGRITHFQHRDDDTTSISFNDVRSIHEDKSGFLWVGTYGGGINRFDPSTQVFRAYTERHGLSNNFVYGILEDEEGSLWISTNKGISKFTPATERFRNFSTNDGLQSLEFNTGAFYRTTRGEMLFGGMNGFNIFHPLEIKDNPHIPPIVITNFKIFDREVRHGLSLVSGTLVELEYNQNFFSFEFAALDFVDPSRNQFAYRLEGFDPDWVYSGTRRYASYTNLDPGSYTFRVKGSNNDGVWNEEGTSVRVVIIPPFWMTTWFRVMIGGLGVAFLVGIVWYASRRKLQQQIHEMEKQRALQAERERISRDLHDHTGAQLTSIISGIELARKYSDTSRKRTQRLLSLLLEDARTSMSLLRDTIWALKTDSMTMGDFASVIGEYMRRELQYRRKPAVRVTLKCNGELELSPIQVLNLFRIIQESFTNALKHARPTLVETAFYQFGSRLILEIRNDDTTRRKTRSDATASTNAKDSGHGLPNMERRAAEMGGTMSFTVQGKTSVVRVEIPLSTSS